VEGYVVARRAWLVKSASLVIAVLVIATVSAQVEVGVRGGDRIEYRFEYSGDPPENRTETSKVEVLRVTGTQVELKTTAEFSNGTDSVKTDTYDVETGVKDLFLIPAGLSRGDEFFHEDMDGNVTIDDERKMRVAGADRNVLVSMGANVEFGWDQETGVLVHVQIISNDYTSTIDVVDTNMWEADGSDGTDDGLPLTYTVFGIAVVIVLLIVVMAASRKQGDGDTSPPELEPGVRM
jgi:hypothetical protein